LDGRSLGDLDGVIDGLLEWDLDGLFEGIEKRFG
jgi:hypothetical protein